MIHIIKDNKKKSSFIAKTIPRLPWIAAFFGIHSSGRSFIVVFLIVIQARMTCYDATDAPNHSHVHVLMSFLFGVASHLFLFLLLRLDTPICCPPFSHQIFFFSFSSSFFSYFTLTLFSGIPYFGFEKFWGMLESYWGLVGRLVLVERLFLASSSESLELADVLAKVLGSFAEVRTALRRVQPFFFLRRAPASNAP